MPSGLYKGIIYHHRFAPRAHTFAYPVAMPLIDLDELPQLEQTLRFFSVDRFNWASFRRTDHFAVSGDMSLKAAALAKLYELTGAQPQGKVLLLTQLRYLGIYFSPINIYYCYHGDQLTWLLAEVTNIPWRERHYYAVPAQTTGVPNTAKAMHVSPFMPMDMQYFWHVTVPADELLLRIENYKNQQRIFTAALQLHYEPLTNKGFNRLLRRRPLMTARVILAIHWQALKLLLKRLPVYAHPRKKRT